MDVRGFGVPDGNVWVEIADEDVDGEGASEGEAVDFVVQVPVAGCAAFVKAGGWWDERAGAEGISRFSSEIKVCTYGSGG